MMQPDFLNDIHLFVFVIHFDFNNIDNNHEQNKQLKNEIQEKINSLIISERGNPNLQKNLSSLISKIETQYKKFKYFERFIQNNPLISIEITDESVNQIEKMLISNIKNLGTTCYKLYQIQKSQSQNLLQDQIEIINHQYQIYERELSNTYSKINLLNSEILTLVMKPKSEQCKFIAYKIKEQIDFLISLLSRVHTENDKRLTKNFLNDAIETYGNLMVAYSLVENCPAVPLALLHKI